MQTNNNKTTDFISQFHVNNKLIWVHQSVKWLPN